MEDFPLTKVLDKVTDDVDLAVVLLASTVGFSVDAALNAVGFLEPGYAAALFASGALGLKKNNRDRIKTKPGAASKKADCYWRRSQKTIQSKWSQ